ncbi:MAG TPA: GNAT family N-acetyltransferase [Clostridiaceae bacterium]|nr:GNAT family N-acetyltransferase [Clostridiaceae bacterium]
MNDFSFTPFPVLQTKRFILRKIKSSDAKYIFSLRSDQSYADATGIQRYETMEEAKSYVQRIVDEIQKNQVLMWSIEMKDTKDYVGGICLWNLSEDKSQAEIGYDLLPEHRGHQYLQEVIDAVTHYAFDVMKLDGIVAEEVRVNNVKSIRVLERFGFIREKTFEVPLEDGRIERRANYRLVNPRKNP